MPDIPAWLVQLAPGEYAYIVGEDAYQYETVRWPDDPAYTYTIWVNKADVVQPPNEVSQQYYLWRIKDYDWNPDS